MLAASCGGPGAWLSGINHHGQRTVWSHLGLKIKPLGNRNLNNYRTSGMTGQRQSLLPNTGAGFGWQGSWALSFCNVNQIPSSALANDACSHDLRDDYSLKSWLCLITLEIIYSWQPRLLTWTSKYQITSYVAPLTDFHLWSIEQESVFSLQSV